MLQVLTLGLVRQQRSRLHEKAQTLLSPTLKTVKVPLASSDAKYIHSTTLFIDGGLTQNMGQGV